MLPSGCKRVEYIESTGSQYIDTEFKPNQDTRVIIDYQITTAQTIPLFGARNGSTNREFEMFAYADGKGIQDGYGSSQDYVTSSPNLNRTTIDKNKNVTTSSDGSVNKTHAAQTFQCSYNMYLFQMNNGGQIYNASYGSRCYSCQIYDNGTLIRDYIPYIDENGDANLWDNVNESPAKKVGTFVAGPEVVPQLPQLITDRTQNDVEEAKRIRAKLASGEVLTDAESAAYFAGLRGCYNASDMNRVGNAVRYIADRLNAEGYGVVVHPRIGWTMKDIVRKSDWKAYLDEVQKLRYVLTLLPTTPEITDAMYDGIDHIEANHIEQILVDLDTLITRMIAGFYYSGELFAGEV